MIRSAPALLSLSALAAFAAPPMHDMLWHHRQMRPKNFEAHESLLKMKVYLKGGSRTPPLDSFRLVQGEPEIWRWENESAFFKKGRKIAHRIADLDSVVLEKQGMAFPAPTGKHMLFLQEAGAINFYAFAFDATDLPAYLKKGAGPLAATDTRTIRAMVADDPEAARLMERYRRRWYTRLSVVAAGAGLLAGGLVLSEATLVEDESGERKPTTLVPGIMAGVGLITMAVPLTPYVNFIWNRLPKRALDTYNRNRKTVP